MAIIDRVKTITDRGVEDNGLIEELIELATASVNAYCNTSVLPVTLDFIVVEMVVARLNRLGTEGLKSEQVDVVRQEFFQDTLAHYKPFLDKYNSTSHSSVRFV